MSACNQASSKQINFQFKFISKQHDLFYTKAKQLLQLRSKKASNWQAEENRFYYHTAKKITRHFSNLSGGTCKAKLWNKRFRHLNCKDVAYTTDEAYYASDFCEKFWEDLSQKWAITNQLKNWKKFSLTLFDHWFLQAQAATVNTQF